MILIGKLHEFLHLVLKPSLRGLSFQFSLLWLGFFIELEWWSK